MSSVLSREHKIPLASAKMILFKGSHFGPVCDE